MKAMRGAVGIALVCVLAFGPARSAAAGDRTEIKVWNVGGQAGMTLASAVIQGKIRSWRDVWKCLGVGALSGAGIYGSKALVAKNHAATGWILANLSGSLTENAAAGRHPLSQLGYTFGPFRFRVAVPGFDREAPSRVAVDLSAYETVALLYSFAEGGHPRLRAGLVSFKDSPEVDQLEKGFAAGVFPTVLDDDNEVWLHEFTHAVQALQVDVAEPRSPWKRLRFDRPSGAPKRLITFENVRFGMFNWANDAIMAAGPYHERWTEIEAFRLISNTPPSRAPRR